MLDKKQIWAIFLKFIFNWRIIALQIVLVSAIHQHDSAIGIHMFPLSWPFLPPPVPSQPSRLSQSTGLSSLGHTANSHWLSVVRMAMYMFPCSSLHSSHPLLPPPQPLSISLFSMTVVHIYDGILLSHKKDHIWVSSNEVDEPRAYDRVK